MDVIQRIIERRLTGIALISTWRVWLSFPMPRPLLRTSPRSWGVAEHRDSLGFAK